MAQLQNKAGNFVAPTHRIGRRRRWRRRSCPTNLIAWVSDPEGDASYPIVTYTWMIFYQKYEDAKKVEDHQGRDQLLPDRRARRTARPWVTLPLPAVVVEKVKAALDNIHGPQHGEGLTPTPFNMRRHGHRADPQLARDHERAKRFRVRPPRGRNSATARSAD